MKLSEAIRLGAMIRPQGFIIGPYDCFRKSCALGAALEAVGLGYTYAHQKVKERWTWINNEPVLKCPECKDVGEFQYIVGVHLNDFHRWTRERIADWVATIEPQEPDQALEQTSAETAEVLP